MELEEFLKKYKYVPSYVASKFKCKYLDPDDISELQYTGLWRAYSKLDPTREVSFTYILTVITNYAINIINRKKRWYLKEVPLGEGDELSYTDKENISDYFTDAEWPLVQQILEGKKKEDVVKDFDLYAPKYKRIKRRVFSKRLRI